MPSLTADLISLLSGVLFLTTSFLYTVALVIPALGKRMYGTLWPNALTKRSHRRAAYLWAFGCIGFFFFLGCSSFLRQITKHICDGQATVERASIFLPMLGALCMGLALIAKQRARIDPPRIPQNAKSTQRSTIIACVLVIVLLMITFFVVSTRINDSFEPLERVQMVSATEGWAIGNSGFSGVMYHYHNGVWRKEPIPAVHLLTDIAMVSSEEGWAVSNDTTMLHYTHGTWSSETSPVDQLTGIDMVSAEEGWAVGYFGHILHYVDGQWIKVPSPTTKTLHSIAMVSAGEGWAVGGDGSSRQASVILHYQNSLWTRVDTPFMAPLNRIQMISADEGWIVGGSRFNPTTNVILHYQNGIWNQEPSPVALPLIDVSMASATEGWAVGGEFFHVPLTCQESSQSVELHVLLHYADGAWTHVTSPTDRALRGVSMITNDTGVIVGWNTFLHYGHGTWQEVQPESVK